MPQVSPTRPESIGNDRERLGGIETKVRRGERLTFDDGLFLYRTPDLNAVGRLANVVRERPHGNRAYFNVNRHLNPTNICYVECALCAWARKPGQEGGYLMGLQEAVDHAADDWRGHVGVVTTFIPRTDFDPANTIALVCGPELMMTFAVSALQDAGVSDEAIYMSMERNMKCAVGLCGHCQFGPVFVCKDGPIYSCGDSELCWLKEV